MISVCVVSQSQKQAYPNTHQNQPGLSNILPAMAMMDGFDMKDIVGLEIMSGGQQSGNQTPQQQQQQRINQLIGLELMDGVSDNILPFAMLNGGMGQQANHPHGAPVLEQSNPNTRSQNQSGMGNMLPAMALMDGVDMKDLVGLETMTGGLSGQQSGNQNPQQQQRRMNQLIGLELMDGISDNILPFAMMNSGMGQTPNRQQRAPVLEQVNPNTRQNQSGMGNMLPAMALMDGIDMKDLVGLEIMTGGLGGQQSRNQTPQQQQQQRMNQLIGLELMDGISDNILPYAMINGGIGQNPNRQERSTQVLEQVNPNTHQNQSGMGNMLPAMALMDGVDMKDLVGLELMSGGLGGQQSGNQTPQQQQHRMNQLIGLELMDGISDNILPYAMINGGMGQHPHRTTPVLKQGRLNGMPQSYSSFSQGTPGSPIVQSAMMGNDFATDMAEANVIQTSLSGKKPDTNMLVAGAIGDSDASQQMLEYEELTHGTKNPQFYQLEALAARDGDAAETAMLAEIVREDTPQQLIQAELMGNEIAADALKYEFMHGMIPASVMGGQMINGNVQPNRTTPVLKQGRPNGMPQSGSMFSQGIPRNTIVQGAMMGNDFATDMTEANVIASGLSGQKPNTNMLIAGAVGDSDASQQMLEYEQLTHGTKNPQFYQLEALAARDGDAAESAMLAEIVREDTPQQLIQAEMMGNEIAADALQYEFTHGMIPASMLGAVGGQMSSGSMMNQQPHSQQPLVLESTHVQPISEPQTTLEKQTNNILPAMALMDGVDLKDLVTIEMMSGGLGGQQGRQNHPQQRINQLIGLEMMDGISDNILPFAMMNGIGQANQQSDYAPVLNRIHPFQNLSGNPHKTNASSSNSNGLKHGIRNVITMEMMDGDVKDLMTYRLMNNGKAVDTNTLISLEMMDGTDAVLPLAMMNGGMGSQQSAYPPQQRSPVLEQANPNTSRRRPGMNGMLPAMALMDGDAKDIVAFEMMTDGLGGQSQGNHNQQQQRLNQLIRLELMDGISDNILPFAMMNGQGHQIPRLQKSAENLPRRKD